MFSFYIKFWTDKLTDIMTGRRTPVKQLTPDLSMREHKSKPFANILESEKMLVKYFLPMANRISMFKLHLFCCVLVLSN